MSKKLTYTLLGEGFAEYAFMKVYLERMVKNKENEIQVVPSKLMKPSGGNSSSSQVLANIKNLCVKSFIIREDIQLFIAGIDLDTTDFDDNLPKYKAKLKEMTDKLGKLHSEFQNKIILFVPIQAIDCWILYQNYRLKNDTKPANNLLESVSMNDTKKRLYGKDVNQAKIERIVEQVVEKADFEELAKQSKSFNLFHEQIKKFIAKY